MAYDIPYHRHPNFRPVDDLIAGNSNADNPVEFDLVPAWGADLARIRSIVHASMGLVQGAEWGDDIQRSVIASFGHGAPAFINCVEAIRGLTVPAAMGLRAGLIQELPMVPGTTTPNPTMKIPVTTGLAFSKVCGAVAAMALHVAMKIAEISAQGDAIQDGRFFVQPSGSGPTGTPAPSPTTAAAASPTSRRRGTAGKRGGRTAK